VGGSLRIIRSLPQRVETPLRAENMLLQWPRVKLMRLAGPILVNAHESLRSPRAIGRGWHPHPQKGLAPPGPICPRPIFVNFKTCPRPNFALLARNFCVQNVTRDRRTARIKQKIGGVSQEAPRLIVVEARRMGITNTAELSDASNCSRRSVVRRVRHHVGCTIGLLG
jgi:hypothetical protein